MTDDDKMTVAQDLWLQYWATDTDDLTEEERWEQVFAYLRSSNVALADAADIHDEIHLLIRKEGFLDLGDE